MRKLLGLLAGTAIVAAACGGAQTSPSAAAPTQAPPTATSAPTPTLPPVEELNLFETAYAPEAGTAGGQIIVGDWQEATQFNPYYLGQVTEANVASAVWHTLVTFSYDYKYVTQLAADPIPTTENGGVTVGEGGDAMTVTWKIRDGLKWSDGEALTCDDFKYAWEWVLDDENVGVVTAGFEDIKDFECASDTEMIWHFDKIYEGYLTVMTSPLPRHALESIPMADQVNGAGFRPDEVVNLPVSGPFKFGSVTPAAELRLVRNDNWANPRTGQPALLETLIFKWYADADAMIAGYRGNEVDAATDLQDSDIPKVEDLGQEVSAIPALLYEFLRPNWSAFDEFDATNGVGGCSRNPNVTDRGEGCPMSDPAMRQALSFAVDKNAINERLLAGTVQVANTNISPSAWFYADQTPATFDPDKARQILEDAGWVDSDGDGVREKDGITAKIELCTTTRQVRQDTLALIASWLKDVGVDSVVNAVSPADIFADYNESTIETPCVLARSNFDVAEHAFSSSIDPLGNYFSYHSSQFEPNGANDAQVQNTDLDTALDTVKNSVDFVVIKDAMEEFQRVYVDQTVEVPLYYRKNVELVKLSRLGNFFANGTQAGLTWNAEDWYVKG